MKNVQVFCQYCEDIRKEADGKVSLMGILPGEISVPATDGAAISKLCTFISVVVYPENLQSALTIQILWNDDILKESPVPDDLIQHLQTSASEEEGQKVVRTVISYMAQLNNIKIGNGGRLRARVKADNKYVEAVSLRVTTDPPLSE